MIYRLLLLLLFTITTVGCRHAKSLSATDSSVVDEIYESSNMRPAKIVFASGDTQIARHVRVHLDSTEWYPDNGERRSVPTKSISSITVTSTNYGTGFVESLGAGLLGGVLLGLLGATWLDENDFCKNCYLDFIGAGGGIGAIAGILLTPVIAGDHQTEYVSGVVW